jgi:hypothetical protein
MAHWANIDENNIVKTVLVLDNNDPSGDEGYQWLMDNIGGTWIKTSYNTHGGEHNLGGIPLRKNYASIGYKYDLEKDAFIPPKPLNSWILNEITCLWEEPISKPQDGKEYYWDEDSVSWVQLEEEPTE